MSENVSFFDFYDNFTKKCSYKSLNQKFEAKQYYNFQTRLKTK